MTSTFPASRISEPTDPGSSRAVFNSPAMQIISTEQFEAQQAFWHKRRHRIRLRRMLKYVPRHISRSVHGFVDECRRVYPYIPKARRLKTSKRPSMPLHLRDDSQASQTGSKLLDLPREIRDNVWRFVVAEHPITLHCEKGRIAHGSLDGESPEEVRAITRNVLDEIKAAATAHEVRKESYPSSVGLLAVLQTCQQIYTEALPILYKANTFVILDNQVPRDFCFLTRQDHVSDIRSLHFHFRFREVLNEHATPYVPYYGTPQIPKPWDRETFQKMTDILTRGLPNLTNLSIFIQGPLISFCTWDSALIALQTMRVRLRCLDSMTVRLPRPAVDERLLESGYNEDDQARDWQRRLAYIVDGISKLGEYVRVIEPQISDAQFQHDMADWDTGSNAGWKIGTMYLPVRRGHGEVVEQRHYAVPVEDERGTL